MMYPCANVSADQYDVFTNAGPCAAFRAPGQVQGIFGLEQSIDELAERLAIDPIALRDRIDTSGTDDSQSPASAAAARRGEVRLGRPASTGREPRAAQARARDGAVSLGISDSPADVMRGAHSGRRLGRGFQRGAGRRHGTRTILAQVVAEELGLRAQHVGSYIGDTRYPHGPPSGGSRVTGSLTPAARNAAYRAARDFAARLAPHLEVEPEAIVFRRRPRRRSCEGWRVAAVQGGRQEVRDHRARRSAPSAATITTAT